MNISAITSRPPNPYILQHCNISLSLEPTNDWIWSYRMFALTLHVLTFCYGDETNSEAEVGNSGGGNGKGVERWYELLNYCEAWEREKPGTFTPFWEQGIDEKEGRIFPEAMFALDCHGIYLFLPTS
jgi:hypothetical protein